MTAASMNKGTAAMPQAISVRVLGVGIMAEARVSPGVGAGHMVRHGGAFHGGDVCRDSRAR